MNKPFHDFLLFSSSFFNFSFLSTLSKEDIDIYLLFLRLELEVSRCHYYNIPT